MLIVEVLAATKILVVAEGYLSAQNCTLAFVYPDLLMLIASSYSPVFSTVVANQRSSEPALETFA